MAETGAVFGGEHSGHYYYRDNFRADSGIITALIVLELLSRSDQPLSVMLEPYRRYADSGEINTEVDEPAGHGRRHRRARAGRRRVGRPARRADRRARRLVVQRPPLQHRAAVSASTSRRRRRSLRGPRGRGAGAHRRPRRRVRPARTGAPVSLDPLLLDVLACPIDKGPAALVRRRGRPLQPAPAQELRRRRRACPSCWSTRRPTSATPSTSGLSAKAEKDGGARHRSRRGVTPGRTSTRSGSGRPRPRCPSSSTEALESARAGRSRCAPPATAVRAVAVIGLGAGATAGEAAAVAGRILTRRCRSGSAPGPGLPAFVDRRHPRARRVVLGEHRRPTVAAARGSRGARGPCRGHRSRAARWPAFALAAGLARCRRSPGREHRAGGAGRPRRPAAGGARRGPA